MGGRTSELIIRFVFLLSHMSQIRGIEAKVKLIADASEKIGVCPPFLCVEKLPRS